MKQNCAGCRSKICATSAFNCMKNCQCCCCSFYADLPPGPGNSWLSSFSVGWTRLGVNKPGSVAFIPKRSIPRQTVLGCCAGSGCVQGYPGEAAPGHTIQYHLLMRSHDQLRLENGQPCDARCCTTSICCVIFSCRSLAGLWVGCCLFWPSEHLSSIKIL